MNQIFITPDQDLAIINSSTYGDVSPLQKCLIQSGMFLNRYAYILPHTYIPPSLLNDFTSRRVALVFRHDLTTLYWLEKENILPLSDISPPLSPPHSFGKYVSILGKNLSIFGKYHLTFPPVML